MQPRNQNQSENMSGVTEKKPLNSCRNIVFNAQLMTVPFFPLRLLFSQLSQTPKIQSIYCTYAHTFTYLRGLLEVCLMIWQ